MRRLAFCIVLLTLAACANLSDTEKNILKQHAIADAIHAPKEVHLGYLNCYALDKTAKDDCRRKIYKTIANRKNASSWDYILPFDYEAERLGFAQFLHDRAKNCARIEQGPQFSKERNGYEINCTDGQRYLMTFDLQKGWELAP